jgi:Ca2+-binding EF-hand superfamily protein
MALAFDMKLPSKPSPSYASKLNLSPESLRGSSTNQVSEWYTPYQDCLSDAGLHLEELQDTGVPAAPQIQDVFEAFCMRQDDYDDLYSVRLVEEDLPVDQPTSASYDAAQGFDAFSHIGATSLQNQRLSRPRPASAPTPRGIVAYDLQGGQRVSARPASASYSRDLQGLAQRWEVAECPISIKLRNSHNSRPFLPTSVGREHLPRSVKWVRLLEEFSSKVDSRAKEEIAAARIWCEREDFTTPSIHETEQDRHNRRQAKAAQQICNLQSKAKDVHYHWGDKSSEKVHPAVNSVDVAGAQALSRFMKEKNEGGMHKPSGAAADPFPDDNDNGADASCTEGSGLPHNWWRIPSSDVIGGAARERQFSLDKTEQAADQPDARTPVTPSLVKKQGKDVWLALYKKFAFDGEVHRDSLLQILELGGVHGLTEGWIQSKCDIISRYATLDMAEFMALIGHSESKYHDDCLAAFKKFDADDSGYIDKSELASVLESLDATPMVQVLDELLDEVKKEYKRDSEDIDLEQYKHLMHLLRDREGFSKSEYDRMNRAFTVFDRDNSDSLDSTELLGVNAYLYYSLTQRDVSRILAEVDVDGSGTLSRSEFLIYMRKVRELEIRRIQAARPCWAFSLLQTKLTRKLPPTPHARRHSTQQLMKSRTDWHTIEQPVVSPKASKTHHLESPFSLSPDSIQVPRTESRKKVQFTPDADDSRKKVSRARSHLDDADDAVSKSSENSLENFFRHLGYSPTQEVLEEIAADAGFESQDPDSLCLDTAWQMLEIFRRREGFTRNGAADVEHVFGLCCEGCLWSMNQNDIRQGATRDATRDRYLETKDLEIDTADVRRALRWLGYASSSQVLQYLIREVDVDESGKLGITELKKLVRMYRERELQRMPKILIATGIVDMHQVHKAKLNEADFRLALSVLGCSKESVEIEVQLQKGFGSRESPEGIDVRDTLAAAMRCRDRVRRTYRDNCGFGPEEMKRLRDLFEHFDQDQSGEIAQSEVQQLLERMLPGIATSKLFRPKLLQIMRRAGILGQDDLVITFSNFLRLTREFQDESENERLEKEQSVISKSKFSNSEVKSFREIFISIDEEATDAVTFEQVKELISRITPLGDKLTSRLRGMWSAKAPQGVQGVMGSIDFPEFLLLMRQLLDANFAGIQDKNLFGDDALRPTSMIDRLRFGGTRGSF